MMPIITLGQTRRTLVIGATLVGMALASTALGQSYMLQAITLSDTETRLAERSIVSVSMYSVAEAPPRAFAPHDLITILVDESSEASSSQVLETEKRSDTNVRLNSFLDPVELLQLRLRTSDTTNLDIINATGDRQFEGEGDYQRRDEFTARITAEVIEVKPNGNLVLQASRRIKTDDEERLMLLTGVCRQEDITEQNTVLSSQIANFELVQENEGDVRKAARKGLLTRIFDAIFSF
jgi:flagellar L-ring protein precursor FlgH